MFGFGNSKSSSTTNNNIDSRAFNAAGNEGIAVFGNGNSVTDHGSVLASIGFAESALLASYEFSDGMADQVFSAIDKSSEAAFDFVNESTGKAFAAIAESNKRVDAVYQNAGREAANESMQIIKMMAAAVVVGFVVLGFKRAK